MQKTHKKGMLAIEYITCKLIALLNHMCKRVEGCRVRSTCHPRHSLHVCQQLKNAANSLNHKLPPMLQKCHVLHN